MTTLTPSQVYYVRSNRYPDRFYLVTADDRGALDCECPDRQFNRNSCCKHVKAIMAGNVRPSRMRPRPAQPPKPQPAPRLNSAVSNGLSTDDLYADAVVSGPVQVRP